MGDSHSLPSALNQFPRESFAILPVSTETEGHMPAVMGFPSHFVWNNLVSVTALLPPESPYCSPAFMGFQSDL